MKRLVSIGLGALFVAISTHGSLFAQASSYGSGGGGGGASGGGTFGSSGSAFGSSGSMFGSSGSSSSLSTGLQFSSTGAGATGLVGMTAGGMYGATGSGGANAAGRTGAGSSSSSSQYGNRSSAQGGQNGGAQGRAGGGSRRGGTGQAQGQQGQGGAAASKDQQVWFEPRIEVGFAVASPAPVAVQSNIVTPLHSPGLTARFGTVNVSVQGGTVILRGSVTSDEDRLLAAQMALLEPSVSNVQNELIVAAPVVPAARPPR
jgi:hypothetical protein